MKKGYSLNTFLPLLLFTAVALVILILFLAPTAYKAIKTFMDLGVLRSKVIDLSKKSDTLEKIDETDLKDKYDRVNYYLPSNKDVSVLMDSISMITNQTGVAFESMRMAPGELATPSAKLSAGRDLFTLEVSITVNGDLPGIIKFIQNAEKASPVVKFEKISMGKKSKVSDQGSLKPYVFEVILMTYYKPFPTEMGKLTDKVNLLSDEDTKFVMSLPKQPQSALSGTDDTFYNSSRTDPFSRF